CVALQQERTKAAPVFGIAPAIEDAECGQNRQQHVLPVLEGRIQQHRVCPSCHPLPEVVEQSRLPHSGRCDDGCEATGFNNRMKERCYYLEMLLGEIEKLRVSSNAERVGLQLKIV